MSDQIKIRKSNLKIKKRDDSIKKKNEVQKTRREKAKDMLSNANLIFGIDNGVTRNYVGYHLS